MIGARESPTMSPHIQCRHCGLDNPTGEPACLGCGRSLLLRACPRCKAVADRRQRYCGGCGASLLSASAGSTALDASGAEDVRRLDLVEIDVDVGPGAVLLAPGESGAFGGPGASAPNPAASPARRAARRRRLQGGIVAGMAIFLVSLATARWILSEGDEFDSMAVATAPSVIASLAAPSSRTQHSSVMAADEAAPASAAVPAAAVGPDASAAPTVVVKPGEVADALVALNVASAFAGHPHPHGKAEHTAPPKRPKVPPAQVATAQKSARSSQRQASVSLRSEPTAGRRAAANVQRLASMRVSQPAVLPRPSTQAATGAPSVRPVMPAARGGLQPEEILAITPMRRANANRRRCSDAIVSLGIC